MIRRHFGLSLLSLASLALFINGCGASDSPTEPTEPTYHLGVHLIGENLSAGPLWLNKWTGTGFSIPVQVPPGTSVEMDRLPSNVELRGGRFLVYRPDVDGPAPIEVWAEVEYNLSAVKSNPEADLALSIRISVDGAGGLLVTSDHPEIFHLVQIRYS
jgi:hypothetical protein